MSQWPSSKARRVFAALVRIGSQIKRQSGSHRTCRAMAGQISCSPFTMGEELGPRMLAHCALAGRWARSSVAGERAQKSPRRRSYARAPPAPSPQRAPRRRCSVSCAWSSCNVASDPEHHACVQAARHSKRIEVLSAVHTVPAVGFAVDTGQGDDGAGGSLPATPARTRCCGSACAA